MSTLDSIQWHGPAETWTWPLNDDQRARLATVPAPVNGMVEIVGIGPDWPNLILAVGGNALHTDHYCFDGDEMVVRFGSMPRAEFEALPEHEGW